MSDVDKPRESMAPESGGKSRIRLVLFDLDDTLCDYAGARTLRLRRAFTDACAFAPPDLEIDVEALIAESIATQPHGADHFPALLTRYGIESADAAAAAMEWYQTNRFFGLRLFPDALETLALVRSGGRAVGLITNGPAEVQRAKVRLLGLEPQVDFALISGELGIAKPDPAIFDEALRRAGVAAGEALFVGDSPEFDVAGARLAGIRVVWMNRDGRAWEHEGEPPDEQVSDLTSLRALIDGMSPTTGG